MRTDHRIERLPAAELDRISELIADPLNDPKRHTRVQAFAWTADGFPDFGTPVPDGPYAL